MTISIFVCNTNEVDTIRDLVHKRYGTDYSVFMFDDIERMSHYTADVYIIPPKFKEYFNTTATVLYLSNNPIEIIETLEYNPNGYFLLRPIEEDKLIAVFDAIDRESRHRSIFVPTRGREETIIAVKDLNYIHISGRTLRFELANKNFIDSVSLQINFAEATKQYLTHNCLLFIRPSLIINLANIESMSNQSVTFKNKDILYFPRSAKDTIKTAWKEYFA